MNQHPRIISLSFAKWVLVLSDLVDLISAGVCVYTLKMNLSKQILHSAAQA